MKGDAMRSFGYQGKRMAAFVFLLSFSIPSLADYIEEWNRESAGNHHWDYWTTSNISMGWRATGGEQDSGYVSAPLGACSNWLTAYWPAYLEMDKAPEQELVLTPNSSLSVTLNDLNSAILNGGAARLFIGEWIDGSNWVFFSHNTALTVNHTNWLTPSQLLMGGNDSWSVISQTGNVKNATDLYNHPQQYGFVVLGGNSQPIGELGFDSFQLIPEPQTLALLSVGLLIFLQRLRRR